MALSHAQLESVIMERTADLQILTQRLLRVQDEERRKLARDLHDGTGQTLTALKMSVSLLLETYQHDAKAMEIVTEVAELADQAIEEIRTMSYLLHPPLLDEIGFACAAGWFIEGFAKRSGIKVTVDLAADAARLPMNIEIVLFRVLQESLMNVHRHSKALRASVCFRRQLNAATLEVRDFGHGIPTERLAKLRESSAEAGVGLAGVRERLNELNGRLEIESDGHGTILRAIVPLFPLTLPERAGEGREMIHSHADEISGSPIGLSSE
jgi:signal transduction histidine kinase